MVGGGQTSSGLEPLRKREREKDRLVLLMRDGTTICSWRTSICPLIRQTLTRPHGEMAHPSGSEPREGTAKIRELSERGNAVPIGLSRIMSVDMKSDSEARALSK